MYMYMYIPLNWRLPEDDDLSLKHVEEFMYTDNL